MLFIDRPGDSLQIAILGMDSMSLGITELTHNSSMDMQLRAFWRMFNYRPNWRTGSVLLTGSTGFLGAFLLRDLILHTQVRDVMCLSDNWNYNGNKRRRKE